MGGLSIFSGGSTGGVTLPTQTGNNGKYLTTNATTTSWSTIAESNLTLTDVTTANVSTTAHGFTPKLPNDTTKFLRGDGTWAAAGGKQSVRAQARWTTTFSTSSGSYVDVTNATCTVSGLDASKTYDLSAWSTIIYNCNGGLGNGDLCNLTINSTIVCEGTGQGANQVNNYETDHSLSGMLSSVTGATSYTCKIQVKTAAGTMDVNGNSHTLSIMMRADEV
jgi:hypothetical protein